MKKRSGLHIYHDELINWWAEGYSTKHITTLLYEELKYEVDVLELRRYIANNPSGFPARRKHWCATRANTNLKEQLKAHGFQIIGINVLYEGKKIMEITND